jgi:hypothetical protein
MQFITTGHEIKVNRPLWKNGRGWEDNVEINYQEAVCVDA